MTEQFYPQVRLFGDNITRVWGLTPPERVGRIAAKAGLSMAAPGTTGSVIVIASDYAFDPLWFDFMRERPGSVLTIEGVPTMAHTTRDADSVAAAMSGGILPSGLTLIHAEDHRDFYNKTLRKREWPFLIRLTPQAVPEIERRSYYAAYKGVTDILTKYLWPEFALLLTRLAARIGMSPNMVTLVGALLNIAAMVAFWQGDYWIGMALGLGFMVSDTVDGKLARCTITSTGWGEVFDHGIDLVHPPFWWFAWGMGLSAHGLALAPATFAEVMIAIVIGYVAQRMIEGVFIKRFGMDCHVWRPFDSWFRLITARRNPNMVILFASVIADRPDIGLFAVAGWTVISFVVHAVQLAQAFAWSRKHGALRSWMDDGR